jgi:chorismate synthase
MNTLGKKLVFTSFGESHGAAVGGVLDGVRAGVKIDMDLVRKALDKRAGRSQEEAGVSPRAAREQDAVEWLSGVMDGVSLGTPIAFVIRNKDARPGDYDWLKESYRVGHADEVYAKKYGIRDHRGGGRASARETAARVVAGSLAQQLLREKGIDVRAELVQVGTETDPDKFKEYILGIQRDGDSIGGIVECHITGLPAGIGEPIFDKLQSHLAFAMMSINACKGFEYGSGFGNIGLRGSEMYLSGDERLISGGIAGGISDGKEVVFRCVFKPTATNRKTLEATHADAPAGRHDACIAVRAVAVVEAMAALVVADLMKEMEEMK